MTNRYHNTEVCVVIQDCCGQVDRPVHEKGGEIEEKLKKKKKKKKKKDQERINKKICMTGSYKSISFFFFFFQIKKISICLQTSIFTVGSVSQQVACLLRDSGYDRKTIAS